MTQVPLETWITICSGAAAHEIRSERLKYATYSTFYTFFKNNFTFKAQNAPPVIATTPTQSNTNEAPDMLLCAKIKPVPANRASAGSILVRYFNSSFINIFTCIWTFFRST